MDENSEPCMNFDCAALVSLISGLSNEATLNTQLFWSSFQWQLSLSGFLSLCLIVLFNALGIGSTFYLSGIFIGIVGVVVSVLLLWVSSINRLHVDKYNYSRKELEKYLPPYIRRYATMHTYDTEIIPSIKF
ncbi:hypothetical protein ACFL0M_11270 [Thermodesulfobacteriota bacterium]